MPTAQRPSHHAPPIIPSSHHPIIPQLNAPPIMPFPSGSGAPALASVVRQLPTTRHCNHTDVHMHKCHFTPPVSDARSRAARAGLLGQTFDMDGVSVSGRRDTYAPTGKRREVTTQAMAEGAIEGESAEYKVPNAFSVDFKYSRYAATSAARRDVSSLSGQKHLTSPQSHLARVGSWNASLTNFKRLNFQVCGTPTPRPAHTTSHSEPGSHAGSLECAPRENQCLLVPGGFALGWQFVFATHIRPHFLTRDGLLRLRRGRTCADCHTSEAPRIVGGIARTSGAVSPSHSSRAPYTKAGLAGSRVADSISLPQKPKAPSVGSCASARSRIRTNRLL